MAKTVLEHTIFVKGERELFQLYVSFMLRLL